MRLRILMTSASGECVSRAVALLELIDAIMQ